MLHYLVLGYKIIVDRIRIGWLSGSWVWCCCLQTKERRGKNPNTVTFCVRKTNFSELPFPIKLKKLYWCCRFLGKLKQYIWKHLASSLLYNRLSTTDCFVVLGDVEHIKLVVCEPCGLCSWDRVASLPLIGPWALAAFQEHFSYSWFLF